MAVRGIFIHTSNERKKGKMCSLVPLVDYFSSAAPQCEALGSASKDSASKDFWAFLSSSHPEFMGLFLQHAFLVPLLPSSTVLGTGDLHGRERECSVNLVTNIFFLPSEKHGMFRSPQWMLTPLLPLPLDFLPPPGTRLAYNAESAKDRRRAPCWIDHFSDSVVQAEQLLRGGSDPFQQEKFT